MRKTIKRLYSTALFKEFFENEKSSGLVLIACTLISLLLANSTFATEYLHIWHMKLGTESVEYWINDGLMTIFFLLIGLELEREIYIGELANIKEALLPIFAALGGMLIPAGIYLALNVGTPAHSGAGIPMATDIAFALGVLSLLGNRVPLSLKVFLTALAVIDDLGAILVIAIFYTKSLSWMNLGIAMGILLFLFILNRMKIKNLIPYLIGGAIMWYFMLNSGIHATITGVLLAFVIPFGDGSSRSVSYRLQHYLHKPVAFFILPLFALANTAIVLGDDIVDALHLHYSMGIMLGLVLGKPIGITLFSFIAVTIGLCKLPNDLNWKKIISVGFLGGIGFTMSIFVTLLAFDDLHIINNAKFIILISSLIAGCIGFLALKQNLKNKKKHAVSN
ncbi:sodium/proton antiporter, NhaA family [Flavobacterium glycines]|uniref:Na(+)/H(+) antiporter NhaA n=1 Tax=Flavobacterium glycines TaxID=551990 RepID=A0A1B9DKX1_9FLAO|nr:Na+/H+ antiporter NhaA [Flavobacterium glycines]OCB70348.1 sodium:proton antiporter [Flavobacterium glycines]GEL11607.1 Na(+)/H(+) antiporter NhaA [Flavobacterium glycines]SDJ73115.1 sodium/proton antiporter, NhaA family [Flavobacterium glycines]